MALEFRARKGRGLSADDFSEFLHERVVNRTEANAIGENLEAVFGPLGERRVRESEHLRRMASSFEETREDEVVLFLSERAGAVD